MTYNLREIEEQHNQSILSSKGGSMIQSPNNSHLLRNSFRGDNMRASIMSAGGGSTKENIMLVKQLETYSFSNFNRMVQALSNVVDAIASRDLVDGFEVL